MTFKLSLFIFFLIFTKSLFSQQVAVLECKYKITASDKGGSQVTIRTYLIAEDKILSFIENDTSKATLADFNNQTIKVKSLSGAIFNFEMSESRIPMNVKFITDSINGFIGNSLITNIGGDEKISLVLDSLTKIPKYKGEGFFDVFDNGFGFLPIKGVKEAISPIAGHGKITWTISLISKKVSIVNANLFRID